MTGRNALGRLAAALVVAAGPAAAAGGPGSAFGEGLRLTNTAWALGMGQAMAASGEGVSAVSLNPAGVRDSSVTTLHMTHAVYVAGLSEDYLAYAQRLPLGSAFGISLHGLYDLGTARTLETTAGEYAGEAGSFPLAFAVGGAAYALDLTKLLGGLDTLQPSAGIGLRGIYQRLDEANWLGVSADLGFKIRPGSGFIVGGVLQNAGTVRGPSGLPLQWVTGAAWQKDAVFGAADRTLVEVDVLLAVDRPILVRAGGEERIRFGRVSVAARGGWNQENQVPGAPGFSVGGGFRWMLGATPWGVDYAFIPWGVLGGVHALSVTLGLLPAPAASVAAQVVSAPDRAAPVVFYPLKGERARYVAELKEPTELSASLLDLDGNTVLTLIERRVAWAGSVEVTWDGKLAGGQLAPFDRVFRMMIQAGNVTTYVDVMPKASP